ncbi:MAG: hypothetical protein ACI83D_000579 [Planctomycetota bacterium]|jgi:hypothetical protein
MENTFTGVFLFLLYQPHLTRVEITNLEKQAVEQIN